MTRRQKRYEREKERRLKRRQEKLEQYLSSEKMTSLDSLYQASNLSANGVRWKDSVQKFLSSVLFNISDIQDDLLMLKNICLGFICFVKNERGKTRNISSVKFRERVVQKAICKNALIPVLTYNLIEDNSASRKGKGTTYATKRVIKYLRKHYNKYGNEGYALVIDFKGYFENIEHQPCKKNLNKYFSDERILKYANDFIDAFGEKGLGLGSETSQINAIAYINSIDHFIKEKLRIKAYERYMDDSCIIHRDKNVLKTILNVLEKKYKEYGIVLNKKKTVICKLRRGFTFLQTKFILTDNGKVVRKPNRKRITAERRKLKKQAKMHNEGRLSIEAINTSFNGWLESMRIRTARKTVYSMKCLYKKLFMKGVEL
jgi:hypothetical protein